jgi:Ca2+-binding EF-hand superfamily protein
MFSQPCTTSLGYLQNIYNNPVQRKKIFTFLAYLCPGFFPRKDPNGTSQTHEIHFAPSTAHGGSMISSIDSTSSMSTMFGTSAMGQQPPPPPDQDAFQISDTDGDGLVSESELETLTQSLAETTGTSVDTEEALTSFDTDEDGSLSGEELKSLMDSYGFAPSAMVNPETGETLNMESSQISTDAAISAYTQATTIDQSSQLLETLFSQNSNEAISSLDVNV